MNNDDLWGFESNPIPEMQTPAFMLKEQASIFNRMMQSKGLSAEVQQRTLKDSSRLGFALDIVAPALASYRLRIVGFTFSVDSAYPVRITSEYLSSTSVEAESEDMAKEALGSILQSDELRSAIASLIANSNL